MSVRIHFHDIAHSDDLHAECERLAEQLREEFPPVLKCEVTLKHDAGQFESHLHVTGKEIDLAARADASELRPALNESFERARRQLRKHHDKLIFDRRRKAARE